jgi:ABC-type branched-subunit amino acid transport system ATPase component
MIEIKDLTVRFGGVTPLDKMTVNFADGTNGLIGPNGAGKTTFFNVLSGFVRPAQGTVTAFGDNLLGMAHYRRSRWGLRRTFQTEQAIEELTVYDNVLMVLEHSPKDSRGNRDEDVLGAINFVGLSANPHARVGTLGAGDRRLVEIARAVVGSPRVVLLDEPAAGLDTDESLELGRHLRALPEAGVTVLLVDHDMGLVLSVCDEIVVLDFGSVIARGTPAQIREDEAVVAAYLGSHKEEEAHA